MLSPLVAPSIARALSFASSENSTTVKTGESPYMGRVLLLLRVGSAAEGAVARGGVGSARRTLLVPRALLRGVARAVSKSAVVVASVKG